MTYFYDNNGWLSYSEAEDRGTKIAPPAHDTKNLNQPFPFWTGRDWILENYKTPVIVPTQPVIAPNEWHMSKGKFRDRFTSAEKINIEMAALDNPAGTMAQRRLAASVRASLADQRDAVYIDLKFAPTRAGVQNMEALGLLGSVGRALAILDTPVTDEERYKN